jgi:hypothetical protein
MHLDQESQKMAATTRMQLQVAPVAAESAAEVVVEVAVIEAVAAAAALPMPCIRSQ